MGSVIGYQEAHGPVATFETDVARKIKKIEASIEPIQDLHGYDHPWPAGGGKNIGTLSSSNTGSNQKSTPTYTDTGVVVTATGTYGRYGWLIPVISGQTYTVSFSVKASNVGANYNNKVFFGSADGAYSSSHNGYIGKIDITSTSEESKSFTFTATTDVLFVGVYVSISATDGAIELKNFQVELGSTATTYAPYSNICPITGWTGANITHHGKNIAQYWQQAYIGADGSIKTGSTYAMAKPIFVQNGRPIAVSNTAGDYQGIAVFSDSSLENMIYRLANTASTYTASQDCYVVFWFNKVYSEYTQSDFVSRGVQIEFSYSPTDFEPYKHDEYDIAFPSEAGTVYGGKLNIISGELVVDRAMVDLGTLDYNLYNVTQGTLFRSALSTIKITDETGIINAICSNYNAVTQRNRTNYTLSSGVNTKNVDIIDNRYLDAASFKSAMSGVQLVYELATPITYQLTPQEIRTIIGTNTIYADTGDVSVLYPKTLTPAETVSNVSLMELRRSIMMAMQHNYIPKSVAYGVEWNYTDPSTILTRTGAAANFANPIPAKSLNEEGYSPFDNIYPWSEMKRYNIINGEVAYSQDDAGYSETAYDTMVYIPEFYYYANKDTTNQKWNWSISAVPLEGYEKHPGSGRYIGRFHSSGNSSGVYSKSGVSALNNITITNNRTYAHNKGSGWWVIDIATYSAIQMLYLIEFADFNMRKVLGNGAPQSNTSNTGLTTNSHYHTFSNANSGSEQNENKFNQYRWIENPYSKLFTTIECVLANNSYAYITTDNSKPDEVSNMVNTGIKFPNTQSTTKLICGFGYNDKYSWAFIPDTIKDDVNSGYASDSIIVNTSGLKYIMIGYYGGLFHMQVNVNKTWTSNMVGSRLIYIPTT